MQCNRSFEAKESALTHALTYLNDVLGYKIGDVHYMIMSWYMVTISSGGSALSENLYFISTY